MMRLAHALVPMLATACAGQVVPRSVTLVTVGTEGLTAGLTEETTDFDHEEILLRHAEVPSPAPMESSDSPLHALFIEARAAYDNGEFERCVAALAGEERIAALLAEGQRDTVARLLSWRAACEVGREDDAAGARAAATMARLELTVPSSFVDQMPPNVERTIHQARQSVSAGTFGALTVRSPDVEANVSVDGVERGCQTPCPVRLALGDHMVRVDAEGHLPAWRMVTVEGPTQEVEFALAPASPELASSQWAARYADGAAADSSRSMWLLSRALRSDSLLAVLAVEETGGHRNIRGALASDGRIVGRSERLAVVDDERVANAMLNELLIRGEVVRVRKAWQSPWFWVGIIVAAGAAATVATWVLTRPEVPIIGVRPEGRP